MALYDDRRFLLSHINHSFITGDDTGICEVVMLDEEVFENQHQRCLKLRGQDDTDPKNRLDPEAYDLNYESELFESEQAQSYDIVSNLDDYYSHRRRSNTAQRLEKLRKEKINQSRTKTIVWRCNSPTSGRSEDRLSQDSPTLPEVDETSKEDEPSSHRSKSPPRKSGLTRLLEKFPSLPKNPFDIFAQFDGGMSEIVPVKKIMIFVVTDQNQPPQRAGPLEVVIVSTARVHDLIGLICWQYTNEGREPKLDSDIDRYCLRITEDNGEVDTDFGSLNPKEPLSKFNFPSLALTEKTEEKVTTYASQYMNGNHIYGRSRVSTATPTIRHMSSKPPGGRLAALTRMIFKDAKLETTDNQ